GAFVPVQSEPSQVVDRRAFSLPGRTCEIGIFDAQHERAAPTSRHEPVEQCRSRVADVQLTSRARREPQPHWWGGGHFQRAAIRATACAAIASPVPVASTPSFVFPLTLTCCGSMPMAPARLARIASIWEES